jgi:3D-(3,5/4)-trihydroxycyclohexane-1,2-dione acylhydrolase (decyclizing)
MTTTRLTNGPTNGPTTRLTSRLTTAQAIVRWMLAQRTELLDGTEAPLFPAVFAIFGHGNVLGMGTALAEHGTELPVWRGHNEQGMGLAAVGYAKATDRRQVGVVTTSIGPGALNLVTAAGVAHANRLPLLLLPGDTFTSRAPDPVLQQVEHFGDPGGTVNDAFRAVSRYFDRVTRPEQLLATLPQVARVLTDPADCGPVVLALPQDVQAEAFDYPTDLFDTTIHRVPRPRPDRRALSAAADILRTARRPLLVVGGGVRYSGAAATTLDFAVRHGIPVAETTAGRTLVPHHHPLYCGPLGITGSASANAVAADADVVLAVGTRLQDFTTASWTVFARGVRIVAVNTARFDAVKHGSHAVVGDAAECLRELDETLIGWRADHDWSLRAATERATWDAHVDGLRAARPAAPLTYAQVVGVINEMSGPDDYVLTASGGMPGELIGGWRATDVSKGPTMDVEYGFSCMGYELAGAWGAAMARRLSHPDGVVTAVLGDGSYLMANSELYSAAFAGHGFVAVVCDNDGYAVIARLQESQGGSPFNNLYAHCRTDRAAPPRNDFIAHATSMGCVGFPVENSPGQGGERRDRIRQGTDQREEVADPGADAEADAEAEPDAEASAEAQARSSAEANAETAEVAAEIAAATGSDAGSDAAAARPGAEPEASARSGSGSGLLSVSGSRFGSSSRLGSSSESGSGSRLGSESGSESGPGSDDAAARRGGGDAVSTNEAALAALRAAYRKARAASSDRPAVVVVRTDPNAWTDAGAWWEVGVPEVAERPEIATAEANNRKAKAAQVRYLGRQP